MKNAQALWQITTLFVSSFAVTASAEMIQQCVPSSRFFSTQLILSFCDASPINKRYHVEVDKMTGCLARDQVLSRDAHTGIITTLPKQIAYQVWNENGTLTKPLLPPCTEAQAVSKVVE